MLQTTCHPCVSGCGRCLALGEWSRSLPHVPGAARWGGVRGWVIFSLWMLISELRPGSVTSTKGRSCCLQGGKPSGDHRSSCAPQPVELPMERAGPSKRSVPAVSLVLLPTTRCRSLHRRVSRSFWRGRFGCVAAPAVAMPESDLEVTAMLSRATGRVGLEWRKPPCPTLLQVLFRLKALRDMHGGGYDLEVLRRAPYRTWPRATSDEGYGTVSGSCDVHTCGPGAPPLAVSGWHRDADKVGSSRFLYPRLASSVTQPVTWPSSSRLHRSRLRRSNTSCLGGQLLPPPVRRLQRPACSSPRAASCIHPCSRTASAAASKSGAVELGVGRPPRPSWPPSTGGKQRSKRPRDGRPRERGNCFGRG